MADVSEILKKPLEELFGAERRLFLPFLATSVVMAALVWWKHVRTKTGLLRYLFSPRLWLHRSALLDYQLMAVRAALAALLFAPLAISALAIALRVARGLRLTLGTSAELFGHRPPVGEPVVVIAFTAIAFLADDLGRFLVHRAMHRVPMLWEIHKVHHSAEVLTPFTLQRVHPLEGLANGARSALTLGLVTGLFMWLFPGRVRGYAVLGVDAVGFALAIFGANLRHSQVWLSYGPRIERFLISPAQHQIHHSIDPAHHDRNYGAALSIWDWMAGSLHVTGGRERLAYGLPEAEKNHRDDVLSMLVAPVAASISKLPGLARSRADARSPRARAR